MLLSWRSEYKYFLVLIFFFFFAGCQKDFSGERVLFDFESEEELDKLNWSCYTVYSLSDRYFSHGSKSLKLEMYPAEYPGLSISLREKDWSGFRNFCFNIYNPETSEIQISMRIDDLKNYPEYADRYNQKFTLATGFNQICIPFNSLMTSGTKRQLKLGTIYRLMIFRSHPQEKTVLFVDYLRLVI